MAELVNLPDEKSPESIVPAPGNGTPPPNRLTRRFVYSLKRAAYISTWILLWLIPMIIFFLIIGQIRNSGNALTQSLLDQMPVIGSSGIAGLTILVSISWALTVLMIWIGVGGGIGGIGDTYPFYRTTIRPYRAIWISFILVVLVLFLTRYLNYSYIVRQVTALRGTTLLLENMLDTVGAPGIIKNSPSLETSINNGAQASDQLETAFNLASTSRSGVSVVDIAPEKLTLDAALGNLALYAHYSNQYAIVANRLARQISATDPSLVSMADVTTQLVETTDRIVLSTDDLLSAVDLAGSVPLSQPQMRNLTSKAGAIASDYHQAQILVAAAENILPAGQIEIATMYILVSLLYAVFLLFPWILTFMFLLRKRDYLVSSKFLMLQDLGLTEEFRQRSKKRVSPNALPAASHEHSKKGVFHASEPEINLETSIADQAFRNSEYVISLVLLTALTGILWYLVFYPGASSGLARMISLAGGAKALVLSLVNDATPITFGFLGAYFFLIQMFLRRYFAADLNPKAYSYAIVRVLITFILSLTFQLMGSLLNMNSNAANLLAFIVGIFPQVGITWLMQTGNKIVVGLRAPEYMDPDPLTNLDGLNTWHETRLFEEKVENIHNLATASLSDLIINTNFTASQLVDWIDQALLYIHTRKRWQTALYAVGIRTATDLLNCAGVKTPSDTSADLVSIDTLATAINAAQGYPKPVEEHTGEDTPAASEQTQGQTAGTSHPAMSSTPITAEILHTMFTAIRTGPNIDSVLRFWGKKQAD